MSRNGTGTTEKENQRHLQRKYKKEERGRKGTCKPSEHRRAPGCTNILRIKKIVRDEKRSRFLPKKVKKLLDDIFSNASEEHRKILASL